MAINIGIPDSEYAKSGSQGASPETGRTDLQYQGRAQCDDESGRSFGRRISAAPPRISTLRHDAAEWASTAKTSLSALTS